MTPTQRKQILISLSRTIWRILQETPGLAQVATSLETDYDSLSKSKRVTIALIIDAYEKERTEVTRQIAQSLETAPSEERQESQGEYIPPSSIEGEVENRPLSPLEEIVKLEVSSALNRG